MDTVQVLLSISICALVGLLMSRVCKLLKLPAVTGYLIAGILVGCYCLGSFTLPGGLVLGFDKLDHGLDIICSVALGFIAFSIGSEFKLSELKKTGKQATVIGILQALVTTVVCAVVLLILHFVLLKVTGEDILPIPAVLVLSAIATATAPAATLTHPGRESLHRREGKRLLLQGSSVGCGEGCHQWSDCHHLRTLCPV